MCMNIHIVLYINVPCQNNGIRGVNEKLGRVWSTWLLTVGKPSHQHSNASIGDLQMYIENSKFHNGYTCMCVCVCIHVHVYCIYLH